MAIKEKQNISSLIQNQLPDFFADEESLLPVFLKRYYQFLESTEIHFTSLTLNEYAPLLDDGTTDGIQLESASQVDGDDRIILESFRNENSAFEVGETITGQTSRATAKVVGSQSFGVSIVGHTDTNPHHIYIIPISGEILEDEVIIGSHNRTEATTSKMSIHGPLKVAQDFEEIADVSEAGSQFDEIFRKEFLPTLPISSKQNLRRLIQVVNEVYRTRGSEQSYNWLWRAVYDNENIEFFYPKEYIFKLDAGNYTTDKSLLIDRSTATNPDYFSARKITGANSGATAIVSRQQGRETSSLNVVELFLIDIEGAFASSEVITGTEVDGITPKGTIVSILQDITISDGGSGYVVGDTLTIAGGGGAEAAAEVTEVSNGAISDVVVSDGGYGYLGTESVDYFNSGTGGSGASSRVDSLVTTGKAKTFSPTITSFASTQLNAADYTGDLSGHNVNTHLFSNSTTTFVATVNNSTNFATGMFITDTANDVIGTVISVPNSTSIVYGLKSDIEPNFVPGDNATVLKAYYANSLAVPSIDSAVTAIATTSNSTYFGALTLTELNYGTVKTLRILTLGSGYKTKPSVRVSQNTITSFNNDDEILGLRSRFLNFDSNTQFQFRAGNTIFGQSSGARATILDPYLENTGNSIFSTLRFVPNAATLAIDSTDGSADDGDQILLEDGFNASHGSYSGTTSFNGGFRLEDLNFIAGETIQQVGSLINAAAAATNTVSVDNQLRGNSAVLQVGDISIGSISAISITNFGVGYSSIPTVTATGGDNNASLIAVLGALAEYAGSYTNEDGLISGKDRIQDSFYYQEFSYVLKTDIPISTFKDTVKSFIHPAGWALFGEIAFRTTLSDQADYFETVNPGSQLILELNPLNASYTGWESLFETLKVETILPTIAVIPDPGVDDFIVRFREPGASAANNLITTTFANNIIITPMSLDLTFDVDHVLLEDGGFLLNDDGGGPASFVGHRMTREDFVSHLQRDKEYEFELVESATISGVQSEYQYEKQLYRVVQSTVPTTGFEEHFQTERTASITATTQREMQYELQLDANTQITNISSEPQYENFLIRVVQAAVPSTGFEEHFQTEKTASVSSPQNVVRSIESEASTILSTTISTSVQHSFLEYEGGTAFADPQFGSSLTIRTMPTLQDFADGYSHATLDDIVIQAFYGEQISIYAGTRYLPTVQVGDVINLPDVFMSIEQDFNFLIETGSGELLLEDGYPSGHGSYTAETSLHGRLIEEPYYMLYETATPYGDGPGPDGVYGGKKLIPFFQKEDYKYKVESVNSTAFTVGGEHSDNSTVFLPVELTDWNNQNFKNVIKH